MPKECAKQHSVLTQDSRHVIGNNRRKDHQIHLGSKDPANRNSRLHLFAPHAAVVKLLRQLTSWNRYALQLFGLGAAPKCAMAALAPSGHGAEIPSPNRPFPRRRQIEQSPNIQKGSPLKTAAWDSILRRLKRGARVSKLVVT